MKHGPCHLYDDAIRMIRYSSLLRSIWGRRLLPNIMILQKMLECLNNEFLAIIQPKHLDFVF